jgi:hypothetical protein
VADPRDVKTVSKMIESFEKLNFIEGSVSIVYFLHEVIIMPIMIMEMRKRNRKLLLNFMKYEINNRQR